jgi:hypothetical protein
MTVVDTAYRESCENGMGLSSCVSLPDDSLGLKPVGTLRIGL